MRIGRSTAAGLACLALVPVLTSCGGPGTVEGTHVHVLVGAEHDGDTVASVGFGGRISVLGSCLGIDATTVIWPYGTRLVSESPPVIDVPRVGRLRLGDQVSGGGEQWSVHQLPKGIDALPAGCSGEDLLAFWPDAR